MTLYRRILIPVVLIFAAALATQGQVRVPSTPWFNHLGASRGNVTVNGNATVTGNTAVTGTLGVTQTTTLGTTAIGGPLTGTSATFTTGASGSQWQLTSSHATVGADLRITYEASGSRIQIGSEESIKGSGSHAKAMISNNNEEIYLDSPGLYPHTHGAGALGAVDATWLDVVTKYLDLTDGVTAPATVAGLGIIYIDTADGDLKVKFGDGTVRVIVAD